ALDREVKAATYHQLRVERGDDGTWYARVYLDL
ncbi:MAG: archease, partial [Gammaproteobacteria bacterium]|nr:archease [Candidatus Kutchimonas denitrificans]NIU42727.1 archease [Gammaproteobacteria bacterium]NIW03447.1 archease [Gammaproteobacteria bacterium]